MASQHYYSMFLLSLLLLPLVYAVEGGDASYGDAEEKVEVVVEGVVSCQSCEAYGTWSLADSKPISNAKVSVICKNHKDNISYYKVFPTDESGYFYAQLNEFKMDNNILDHPLHSCRVHLVSSPLPTCNHLTNINYGIDGAPLRYNNKRLFGENYEAVVYSVGPFAFRHCSEFCNCI